MAKVRGAAGQAAGFGQHTRMKKTLGRVDTEIAGCVNSRTVYVFPVGRLGKNKEEKEKYPCERKEKMERDKTGWKRTRGPRKEEGKKEAKMRRRER